MQFNLIIILSVLQFCEIIRLSTSVNKNGYCNFPFIDQNQLICHNFTIANINEFTFKKIRPDKIHTNIKILLFTNSHFDFFTRKFFGYFYGSLEYISARNCGISDLLDESFTNVPNMTQLNLESNAIKELRSKTFYNLKKLTYLNLENNLIEIIEPDTFENLTRLENIYLQNNKIKFIISNTFKMIKHIKTLFLDSNPINDELNLNINKINWLSAEDCGFTRFSISVKPGVIQHLGLRNNNLKEVFLAGFKLKNLYLAYNKIKRLDKIDGSELTKLYLNGNSLDYDNIQNDFANMTELLYLNLTETNLVKLNKDLFQSMSNLKVLYIGGNPLKMAEARNIINEIPHLRNCDVK